MISSTKSVYPPTVYSNKIFIINNCLLVYLSCVMSRNKQRTYPGNVCRKDQMNILGYSPYLETGMLFLVKNR